MNFDLDQISQFRNFLAGSQTPVYKKRIFGILFVVFE